MSVANILDLRLLVLTDLHALTAAGVELKHPAGGLAGEGISPFKRIRSFLTSDPASGIAENSAFVYGCSGFPKISAVSPDSTMPPRYITPTVSEICSTTDRS